MGNRVEFISRIEPWKQVDLFRVDLNCNEMYAYDELSSHHTVMTDNADYALQSFNLKNLVADRTVSHICVDGGIVKWAEMDYVGDGKPHGRFDCLIITDEQLLLVELKMSVISDVDKTRWVRFSEALHELKDYYVYMRDRLLCEGYDLFVEYPILNTNIIPFVCMKNPPAFKKKRYGGVLIPNIQRENELDRFRMETGGLKPVIATEYTLL